MGDVNTKQPTSFFLKKKIVLEFNSRKVHQHLTNRTSLNETDEFRNSANLRFVIVVV